MVGDQDARPQRMQTLRFGPFSLDPARRQLYSGSERVHLAHKPLAILEYLVKERPRLVSRDELLEAFWDGANVYDVAIYRSISAIRKALGDTDDPPKYIETRYREGYRFIGKVHEDVSSMDGSEQRRSLPHRRRLAVGVIAAAAAVALVAGRMVATTDLWPGNRIASIAILPVTTETVESWMLDGLTEEISHVVRQIEGLRVISASVDDGVSQFDVERLNADALLASSLFRDADGIVVASQLIRTSDRELVWSYTQHYSPGDIAVARSAIVNNLAQHLSARLHAPIMPPPRNNATWQHYLRARNHWKQRTPGALRLAIENYERAIDAEPDYAAAYVGLAESLLLLPLYNGEPSTETSSAARAAAMQAIELFPDSARAYAVLGVIASSHDWRPALARQYFDRAVALDPNDATTHQWKAEMHCYYMEFDQCRTHMRTALALDPLSPMLVLSQGLPDRFAGNFASAEAYFRNVVDKYPEFPFARYQLAVVLDAQEKWSEAAEHFGRLVDKLDPRVVRGSLARAYANIGRLEEAWQIYHDLVRAREAGYLPPFLLASVALQLKDKELAYSWLEVGLEERDEYLISLSVIHDWRDLRCEDRMDRLLTAVGLPRCRG